MACLFRTAAMPELFHSGKMKCPFRVKTGKAQCEQMFSALPPRADIAQRNRHVRFVPCVDGSGLASEIFTSQAWSVLPCVRPVDAVHMTAGHNALRGSGPGQKPAFDYAMARVGCPDRRIDRLCITCCLPSQPSHHVGYPARSRLPRKCDGLLVTLTLGHHGPA